MILLIIVVAIVGWAIFAYNRLVSLRNQVDNSWRQIDVQLKRRHDLIPNLVEAVKGYMQFERDTLTQVVEARAKAISAPNQAREDGGGKSDHDRPRQAAGGLWKTIRS